MTAEFDSSGFSAVAKFFGNDASEETPTGAKRSTASNNASIRGKRRGGVGASTESSSKQLSSGLLSKKVLTVGRKRNRENDDVDEEAYEGTGLDDHGIDGGDDEVDGGRTSIVKKKTVASKKADPAPAGNNKIKKKLGKKERQRQKEMEDTAAMDVFEPAPEGKDRSAGDDGKTKDASGNETAVAHPSNGESGTKPKKKRKKVRSRQKNIRKDNRSSDKKPAHLIPGSRNYQGRPMTQETRDKLNLPPPNKSKNRNRNFSKPQTDGGSDDLFVIDRNPDTGGDDDLGVQLAIDGFLSGNNDKTEEKKDEQDTETKPTSSKKKKKRFKNL
jgi:hypothetical protein